MLASFADTDLEDDVLPHQRLAQFAPAQHQPPAVSEPWLAASASQSNGFSKADPDQPPSTAWQAHWLELRIHALQHQQHLYELKLRHLRQQQQQDNQAPLAQAAPSEGQQMPGHVASLVPQPAGMLTASSSAQLLASGSASPAAQPSPQLPGSSAQLPAAWPQQTHKCTQPESNQAQSRVKHRRARWPIPGLSVAELANHSFFGQTGRDPQAGLLNPAPASLQGENDDKD